MQMRKIIYKLMNRTISMKKTLLLVVLIGFIAIFSNVNTQAQCPVGYTQKTVFIYIGPCLYQVDLCVKCPTGPVPGAVQIQGFFKKTTPPCLPSVGFQTALDAAEAQILNFDYINHILCENTVQGPPCPDQSDEVQVAHAVCWEAECKIEDGVKYVYYRPCEGANSCVEKYTVCRNPDGSYSQTATYPPTIDGDGTVNCTLEAWEVTEPDVVGQISSCFISHTICNP